MAAKAPPKPKSVKKAIITKSRLENNPIVFDLKVVKINPLFFKEFSVNLRRVGTLNLNLRFREGNSLVTYIGVRY